MNFAKLMLAVISTLILVACGSDSENNGGPNLSDNGIPQSLNFEPKTGEALNAQQKAQVEQLMGLLDQDQISAGELLLVDRTEDYDDWQQAQQAKDQLSNENKTLLEDLTKDCEISTPKVNIPVDEEGQSTLRRTQVTQSSISGNLCPVSFDSEEEMKLYMVVNQNTGAFTGDIDLKMTKKSSVADPKYLPIMENSESNDSNFVADGKVAGQVNTMTGEMDSARFYIKGTGGQSKKDINLGEIKMDLEFELLISVKEGQEPKIEMVIHVDISAAGQKVVISNHTDSEGQKETYLNGEKTDLPIDGLEGLTDAVNASTQFSHQL